MSGETHLTWYGLAQRDLKDGVGGGVILCKWGNRVQVWES
jgi:hypothetical protein